MRLLLDCGNSLVKWQLRRQGAVVAQGQLLYGEEALQREVTDWEFTPKSIFVAAVVDEVRLSPLLTMLEQRWSLAVTRLTTTARFGQLTNGYLRPETLGVDRWLALIGGAEGVPPPLMVADLGSAITVDAVDAQWQHHAGVILPGLKSLAATLAAVTPLQQVSVADLPPRGVETAILSTEMAISQGQIFAIVGAIEQSYHSFSRRFASPPQIVLTGGDSGLLSPHLALPHSCRSDLIFCGMDRVATAISGG
ncbi:MAG: type III pantothenate kinase [Gammaproteobacteria bacterium]|nr:type III pantothenate kinase [Gammaproteobacteria bacterium]